jgi:hypothetical protein
MTRRAFALLAALTLVPPAAAVTSASHLPGQPRKHKVVYHLSEAGVDKARFVLGNVQNTIAGAGGPAHVEAIELVVHGPALKTSSPPASIPSSRRCWPNCRARGWSSAPAATR